MHKQQYDDIEINKIKHLHNVEKDHFNHRSMSYSTTQKRSDNNGRKDTLKTFHANLLFYNNETGERGASTISSLELLFISSLL